ncbi:hypothetical protein [Actinoallomurus acaciae]|uniref:Uncharacterized protein n=1 Tax=Actinoallomurus acaciae TaxID=502577 RepID=A0ABV5YBU5_9ACTN
MREALAAAPRVRDELATFVVAVKQSLEVLNRAGTGPVPCDRTVPLPRFDLQAG